MYNMVSAYITAIAIAILNIFRVLNLSHHHHRTYLSNVAVTGATLE